MEALIKIQSELKAPKNQFNKFGNYKYRSCEDILEAVKPLLQANKCLLFISDEIIQIGERYYVKSIVSISDGKTEKSVTAFAREEQDKKGMDSAQITGAASSYARKYALNGLFLIDDTKDADFSNNHDKEQPKGSSELIEVLEKVKKATDINSLQSIWDSNKSFHTAEAFCKAVSIKKGELIKSKK